MPHIDDMKNMDLGSGVTIISTTLLPRKHVLDALTDPDNSHVRRSARQPSHLSRVEPRRSAVAIRPSAS